MPRGDSAAIKIECRFIRHHGEAALGELVGIAELRVDPAALFDAVRKT